MTDEAVALYASDELEVTYTVSLGESGLVIRPPARPANPLRPITPDTFHAPELVDVVTFTRDAGGDVDGLRLHSGGVWGLRFDRVKR